MAERKRKKSVAVLYRVRTEYFNVGMQLRKFFYKLLGCQIGQGVKLGAIFLPVPEQVALGDRCVIEDNVRLRAGGAWKSAFITIASDTFIGHSTQINVRGIFRVGKNCLIAPLCVFSDAHHTFTEIDVPIKEQATTSLPIAVEDNVWIGTGSIILGGVTIETGAVIAAGAVVNCNVPAYEIWGGVPAKRIKSRTSKA